MGAGFAEPLPGEQVAYLFLLRNGAGAMLGSVGMVSRESNRDPRPFTLVHGLLRPALQCLERELASQSSIGNLQRSLVVRDRDLELLLGAAQDESEAGNSTDDFAKLVQGCVDHLGCAVGALLIPDKNIAVCRTATDMPPRAGADILTRTHRQVLGWAQLHRQTMTSNAPHDSGPFANIPYKILACPVMHGAQRVHGVLVLFKRLQAPDFDLRQVRIVELLGRRVAYILMNSYDPTSGLLTRPAFEKRANAMLTPQTLPKDNCVIYVDIDRLHVLNENLGMHVGDSVIVRVAEVIRQSLSPRMLAARISGDRFAIFVPETSVDTTHDIADNLRHSFERLGFLRERQQVEVTASFGVANIVEGNHPLSHALASAEIACKAAKDRGRNRVETLLRRRPEHRAPLHRPDAHRYGALGAARPALPARGADHRAAERRARDAEVRAAAAHERREGRQRAAGKIPVGRGALPARACDRPLGRAPHDRDADARTRRGCTRCRRVSR